MCVELSAVSLTVTLVTEKSLSAEFSEITSVHYSNNWKHHRLSNLVINPDSYKHLSLVCCCAWWNSSNKGNRGIHYTPVVQLEAAIAFLNRSLTSPPQHKEHMTLPSSMKTTQRDIRQLLHYKCWSCNVLGHRSTPLQVHLHNSLFPKLKSAFQQLYLPFVKPPNSQECTWCILHWNQKNKHYFLRDYNHCSHPLPSKYLSKTQSKALSFIVKALPDATETSLQKWYLIHLFYFRQKSRNLFSFNF